MKNGEQDQRYLETISRTQGKLWEKQVLGKETEFFSGHFMVEMFITYEKKLWGTYLNV